MRKSFQIWISLKNVAGFNSITSDEVRCSYCSTLAGLTPTLQRLRQYKQVRKYFRLAIRPNSQLSINILLIHVLELLLDTEELEYQQLFSNNDNASSVGYHACALAGSAWSLDSNLHVSHRPDSDSVMLEQSVVYEPRGGYTLHVTAKRYSLEEFEVDDPDALTLVFLHSTSFHKETWLPTIVSSFKRILYANVT